MTADSTLRTDKRSSAFPGDAGAGEITGTCLEIAGGILQGSRLREDTDRLAEAAAGWAREGVPIDTILHAIHECLRIATDQVLTSATAGEPGSVRRAVERIVELFDIMNTTVARSYVREHSPVVGEHHAAVHALTRALLSGQPTSRIAREGGLEVSAEYHVLALGIPEQLGASGRRLAGQAVARGRLRLIRSELAHSGGAALSMLSVDGGTVLLPTTVVSDDRAEELLRKLSAVGGVPITGTITTVATSRIPEAVVRAHELLDLVRRLGCEPGLYRLRDVALEYQLSRPGPGRTSLAALLDPLDDHPELLETLRRHIANEFSRRRTARALYIHTNTVDYRLKRIAQLTGIDPNGRRGLWQLRSALIAKAFADSGPSAERTRTR